MALPLFQTFSTSAFQLLQNKWKSQLDPVLANPATNPSILKGVKLAQGDNTVNHLLGQTMQGWQLTDLDSPVIVFRSKPFNNLTLTLNSSGAATVDILVF
jgi:hypothetical protein